MSGSVVDERIIVLDNVLGDPHAFRKIGLEGAFPQPNETPYFPGRNSEQRFNIPALDAHVARVVQQPLKPAPETAHGAFRLCKAGEQGKGGVHIDMCHWSGILYLSLPEHCEGGTDFYRHRATGMTRAPVYPEDWEKWGDITKERLWSDVVEAEGTDPSKWEHVRRIEMKFNRLVLFRPWLWHNAGPGFGATAESARLIYVMFYIVDQPGWRP